MPAFFTASDVDLSTSPVEIVASEDFDRQVVVRFPGGGGSTVSIHVGFTSSEVDAVNEGFPVATGGISGELSVLLPADESLWARADGSGTKAVDVLVTKACSN